MSATLDQAESKQQESVGAANGPSKQADYSYVHGQQQQQAGYMSGQNLVDAYLPSYYQPYVQYPPTQGRPMGPEASWSAAEPVSYMTGGYNYASNMYSPFDYSQQAPYGWFPGGEYGEWGASPDGGYYTMSGTGAEGYDMPNNGETDTSSGDVGAGMKGVEHSMKNMGLGDARDGWHHYPSDGGAGGGGGYSSSRSNTGSATTSSGSTQVQKKPTSWAGIASQPASQAKTSLIPRAPLPQGRGVNNADTAAWDGKNSRQGTGSANAMGRSGVTASTGRGAGGGTRPGTESSRDSEGHASSSSSSSFRPPPAPTSGDKPVNHPGALYNPKEFDLNAKGARFFIIKSYSEDDIHRSIKYSIWCSTEYGNKRLDAAWQEREGKGPVYLLFSVNGSGHFCGMAQMMSAVDYQTQSKVWTQNKWKGTFQVKWIYVKDVPNSQLRHIRLENNEGKPVTNSRDTQEVLGEKGPQVLRIIHQYRHTTSIFDDFGHYEKLQEESGGNQ